MVDGYEKGVSLVRWSLKKAYLTWVPRVRGRAEGGRLFRACHSRVLQTRMIRGDCSFKNSSRCRGRASLGFSDWWNIGGEGEGRTKDVRVSVCRLRTCWFWEVRKLGGGGASFWRRRRRRMLLIWDARVWDNVEQRDGGGAGDVLKWWLYSNTKFFHYVWDVFYLHKTLLTLNDQVYHTINSPVLCRCQLDSNPDPDYPELALTAEVKASGL